jgi:hypothetical protein
VHFDDHLGFGHSDSSTGALSGTAALYGRQEADGSARLLFEMVGTAGDMSFSFTNVDVLGDVDVKVTGIKISAGMADRTINFDPSGTGIIPSGALKLLIDANVNGQRLTVSGANGPTLVAKANFASKTFSIPSFKTSLKGLDLTIGLSGKIVNQPPRATAPAPQTVECTSPTGTEVTLRGQVSDADAEPVHVSWSANEPYGAAHVFSNDLEARTLAPFTPPSRSTNYFLSAHDNHAQTSRADTLVTVRDTTAPALDVSVDPACLWAPNHKLALYELGSSIRTIATDACDTNLDLVIESVTSNQPALGEGSGNTPLDVVVGKRAFCIRAERQGTQATARAYTLTVAATDASGNVTRRQAIVRVEHDQNGPKCAKVDPSRLVPEGDPRCAAN